MYRKKHYASLLKLFALVLLTGLLVACGSTSTTQNAEATGTTTPDKPTETSSTPAQTKTSPTANSSQTTTHDPLTSIRMVDKLNGWALSKQGILKTTDGGQHWQSVTPSNITAHYTGARGAFLDNQNAWVATVQQQNGTITILHTTDGGQHWQNSQIQQQGIESIDMPHFVNANTGWLEVMGSPGAGSQGVYIYHTTDGSQWELLGKSGENGINNGGFKSGISPLNAETFFATTRSTTGNPTDPGLYVSHDGAQSWQQQHLNPPHGNENVQQMGTTPPVFFGNDGFLPVYITNNDGKTFLNLYRSENGGADWMAQSNVEMNASTVFVLDKNHAWASDQQTGKLYYTANGGASWQATEQAPGAFEEMSFVDASNGWAITKSALLHTTDGGKTWQEL
uniref:Photosynthesis system II assembly factor Ycf48/Hcf136-like domain-containing protein n=1 Tax=Thermosporothrix sp. COM3 TaxID=2490863 RepID=A0A455SHY9_9CHLR|nr:hypothetical protein KTC_17020 [Thermosporothrix sp. COM3]